MITYTIANMTCANCVRHVTRAVQSVAPEAHVETDLPQHRVRIETQVDESTIRQALQHAGYPPAA